MTRQPSLKPQDHGITKVGSAALWQLADIYIERALDHNQLDEVYYGLMATAAEIQRAAEIVEAHRLPSWYERQNAAERMTARWMGEPLAVQFWADVMIASRGK